MYVELEEGTTKPTGDNRTIIDLFWVNDTTDFTKVNCVEEIRCDQMNRYIHQDFLDELMIFKNITKGGLNETQTLFQQPVATRNFIGFLQYIDRYRNLNVNNEVHLSLDGNNFAAYFNCREEAITQIKRKGPVEPEKLDIGFMDNVLEWLFPWDISIELEKFLKYELKNEQVNEAL